MNRALQIAVDLEQGEIRLGSEQIRLLPVAGDVFCLKDARGPLVRALKFEERSMLLADAGDKDVASVIADAALVSSGVATDEVRVAASLALAGGGEKAPSFPDCAEFVEQRYGWDEKRVSESMALVIDRLCSSMVKEDSNGWKQIVFEKSDADLGTLISQMATNLSQRSVTARTNNDPQEPQQSKQQPSASRQPSRSSNHPDFELSHAASSHESIQSVSSVLPPKRVPFRVRGVTTDRPAHSEPSVITASVVPGNTESKTPAITFPKLEPLVIPQPKHQSAPADLTTTTAQATDFPSTPITKTNPAGFSPFQTAAPKIEPLPIAHPAPSFPIWQPFITSTSSPQPSSEPVQKSSRASGVTAATNSLSPLDWLAELAQLLEVECDLRGIDP